MFIDSIRNIQEEKKTGYGNTLRHGRPSIKSFINSCKNQDMEKQDMKIPVYSIILNTPSDYQEFE